MSRIGAGVTNVNAAGGGGGGSGTIDSAVVSSVAAATSSTTLLVASGNRGGALFVNDSTSPAYLKLGTVASPTSYTTLLAPNGYYQLDYPIYTGEITAIWTSATGSMRITELLGPVIPSGTPVALASTIVVEQGTTPWVIQEPLSVDDNGGSLTVDGSVSVSNFPATQPVSATDLDIRNLVFATDKVDVSGSTVTITDGAGPVTVDGTVSVGNFPAVQPVNDNGGSLTVDGSVAVSNFPAVQPVSDNGGSLTVDGTVALDAGTLAALESITVQNGAGAAAVNVQDGGNSLTVDGSVSVSNFPATQPVSGTVTANAGTGPWPVTDNGGSLTVDGSVSLAAALPAGTNNIGDVDVLTMPAITGTVTANAGTGTFATRDVANAWTWTSVHSTTVAVNTIFLDTGALVAGTYDFDINLSCFGALTAGLGVIVEHRNAANSATLQTIAACQQGGTFSFKITNYVIATNERIRVTNPVALTAAVRTTAAIGRRISV